MQFKLLTPHRSFFDGPVTSAVIPGLEGYIGFLDGHVPFVTPLGTGIVELTSAETIHLFGVSGGYFEFAANGCVLLAENAWVPEEIEPAQVSEELKLAEKALAQAGVDADQQLLKLAVDRATVRLELFRRVHPA